MIMPSYPLFTVDPMVSIWSREKELNYSDTMHWCGDTKKVFGFVEIDKKRYRFLGKGDGEIIKQTNCEIDFLESRYTFENEEIILNVNFISPFVFADLSIFSSPVTMISYDYKLKNSENSEVKVTIEADKGLCYKSKSKSNSAVETIFFPCGNGTIGRLGLKEQKPLYFTADGTNTDWGYICLYAQNVYEKKSKNDLLLVAENKSEKGHFIFGFDDIFSCEYFGEKLKGYWTERFNNIEALISWFNENFDYVCELCENQSEKMLADCGGYAIEYSKILKAAFRQVCAAHKLMQDKQGNLLYFSKECHSNGCINTVDVSYPSIPLFLLYKPELVKGMLTGIFNFANMSVWKYDFAPHDLGRYPIANGQAYSMKRLKWPKYIGQSRKKAFMAKGNIYREDDQMPVEECGNMLLMSYAYARVSDDVDFLNKNFDTLKLWAEYLVQAGVVLKNQLCTDDFAGHCEKNVNLAIKSCEAVRAFAEICSLTGKADKEKYSDRAKNNAKELVSLSQVEKRLSFSIGNKDSWSIKYNMVWDIVFDFGLFDGEIYAAESEKYRKEILPCGVPLDFRCASAKADWLMWASVLDKKGKNVDIFSECLNRYLESCPSNNCFGDYYEADSGKDIGMNHRSVMGGLWMPIFKKNNVIDR